jgi:hypothetical protein
MTVTHKYQISPSSQLSVTGCHQSPLTSSAPDLGLDEYNKLPKILGKQLTELCVLSEFLLCFWKLLKGSFMIFGWHLRNSREPSGVNQCKSHPGETKQFQGRCSVQLEHQSTHPGLTQTQNSCKVHEIKHSEHWFVRKCMSKP